MSHLIAISIGPVQDFISSARRTNDLYAGSKLLREIVDEAASVIDKAGGTLIFPSQPGAAGANKILAALPADADPRNVCADARDAAKGVLTKPWDALLEEYGDLLHEDQGRQQIAHFLEFYAAWWPWDWQDATYAEARQQVERLLAGRKALRDFSQPIKNCVPKSPLDPSRDTVLTGGPTGRLEQGPLWLKPNEHLDAVSLIKRATNEANGGVPSTVDIAGRCFLAGRPELRGWLDSNNLPHGVVHASRRDELRDEGKITEGHHAKIVQQLGNTEPTPYFAILVADGDRMGDQIRKIRSLRKHQEFSKQVSGFAKEAETVIGDADGHLVYAGGDDVLAFLPLHTCLRAAAELARKFTELTEKFTELTEMNLTVGLAIVHYMEPLYITLDVARRVERAAKDNGRNRLRVEWHTRGGQSRAAEHSWAKGFDLTNWSEGQELFRQGLTRGFAYELATLGREAKRAGLDGAVLRAEADRIFKRKEWDAMPKEPEKLPLWREACDAMTTGDDALQLSERLILMQGLASRTAEPEGRQ